MSKHDSWCTTQDRGVMVISESNASGSGTMSSLLSDFEETDAMFLEFDKDLNTVRRSSSVGDNSAMNRFVEHQMLPCFKEFRGNYHRHFKKYSNLEEACANPPYILHKLIEQRGEPVDCVELFKQIHVQDGTFVSQATEDVYVDDRATQKILVGDPSPSSTIWPVLAVPRPCIRNPRSSNYESTLMKLNERLKNTERYQVCWLHK
ncbi:CACTA en-spm transposon protein [Cucumis melo var. makuwa]|uniref:CACTA en-spm transposon protein n=1 Tax=Cucumis melo var. makuwa TaxID=1194695 RepID=A0A5A7VME1_CUCMM|nr:CACTA en-spm transposon protein [Cucumis melo var. makuwa]